MDAIWGWVQANIPLLIGVVVALWGGSKVLPWLTSKVPALGRLSQPRASNTRADAVAACETLRDYFDSRQPDGSESLGAGDVEARAAVRILWSKLF